jgi:hypothetical protein
MVTHLQKIEIAMRGIPEGLVTPGPKLISQPANVRILGGNVPRC